MINNQQEGSSHSLERRGSRKGGAKKKYMAEAILKMAAPVTNAVTLSPQREAFAPAAAVAASTVTSGNSHPTAAVKAADIWEAKRTSETAASAATLDISAAATAAAAASTALDVSAADATTSTALNVSAAAASAALDAQATSETVSSTLMGIALLAYLQGSAAKHEARGGGGGYGSVAAPSSSSQGGLAAARPAAGAGAGACPYERLPPRRYQRMSPVDTETPTEPLTRTLAAIKASQSKAQYTCKRYELWRRGEEEKMKKERRKRERRKRGGNEREEKERE